MSFLWASVLLCPLVHRKGQVLRQGVQRIVLAPDAELEAKDSLTQFPSIKVSMKASRDMRLLTIARLSLDSSETSSIRRALEGRGLELRSLRAEKYTTVEVIVSYLQNMEMPLPPWVSTATSLLHVVWAILFVVVFLVFPVRR